jgi:hypothetical protein
MLQVEPTWKLDEKAAERWALMQKLPASSQNHSSTGEWFTSSVDMREDKNAESLAIDNKLGRSWTVMR